MILIGLVLSGDPRSTPRHLDMDTGLVVCR